MGSGCFGCKSVLARARTDVNNVFGSKMIDFMIDTETFKRQTELYKQHTL